MPEQIQITTYALEVMKKHAQQITYIESLELFGDEVKLIKSDYATSALLGTNGDYSGDTYKDNTDYYKGNLDVFDAYYWNGNNQNTWSESLLNKINLNTNYLNNIGNDWNNKIANHTWQIGGNTYDNILKNTVKNTY